MISELPCGNNFLTRIGGVLQKLSDVLPNATPFPEKTIRRNTGDGGKKNTIEVTFINTSPNVQFSDMFCTTTFGYAIFKRPPFNILIATPCEYKYCCGPQCHLHFNILYTVNDFEIEAKTTLTSTTGLDTPRLGNIGTLLQYKNRKLTRNYSFPP
jgi:hypothetical protein